MIISDDILEKLYNWFKIDWIKKQLKKTDIFITIKIDFKIFFFLQQNCSH